MNAQIAYNEARASEATAWAGKDSLYKLSFTLTPHATDIVASVLPGKRPRNLEALALGANARYGGLITFMYRGSDSCSGNACVPAPGENGMALLV
jgi:hypothetical protein